MNSTFPAEKEGVKKIENKVRLRWLTKRALSEDHPELRKESKSFCGVVRIIERKTGGVCP